MLKLQLLIAAAAGPDPAADLPQAPTGTSNLFGGGLREMLLIIGVAAVLALTLFLYVYITRRDHRVHSVGGSRAIYRREKHKLTEDDGDPRKRRKKRRRREEFANRNPTLGETGGLPPLREEPTEPAQ